MLYVERLGYEFAAMLVTLHCISYFVSQKFALILPGTYSLSHKEKKADKVCICKFNHSILSETGKITHRCNFSEDGLKCHPKLCKLFFLENMDLSEKNVLFCQFKFVYFLQTTMTEWSIFWINMMVCMSLVVHSALF